MEARSKFTALLPLVQNLLLASARFLASLPRQGTSNYKEMLPDRTHFRFISK